MNVIVFDTETTSLDKPFCYNIGYDIMDIDSGLLIVRRDFVVEQIWHNLPLFSTAYYAEKRPIYVSAMKGRRATLDKWGYIMRIIARDIKDYDIKSAYAYNSPFDEKVLEYNNDWYKTINPFDTVPIYDIRGYAVRFLVDDAYKLFCEENSYFTDTGNYSTTAEVVYKYLSGNTDFIEEHTALADSEIESTILYECLTRGAEIATEYPVPRSIPREQIKNFSVKKDGEIVYSTECRKITVSKDKQTITLK